MATPRSEWRLNLCTAELWNCSNAFEFECPRYFSELEPTDDAEVRFCNVCSENVHRARTPLDFTTHGQLGHCVAIPENFYPMAALVPETLGRPTRQEIERQDQQAQDVRAWWLAVLAEQPQFAPEAIAELTKFFSQNLPKPTGQPAATAK